MTTNPYDDPTGSLDWARANYPGGYEMNGAGQPVRQPVYDDPETRHLYPQDIGDCRFCGVLLNDSVCEGHDLHCQSCRDDGNCPICNGAPSVTP